MNTLRLEIREWLKKYCKLHSFRISGEDIPMEYETKDGRIVDNRHFVYTTQSYRFNSKNHCYFDKVTIAFNYIYRISHWDDCRPLWPRH